MRLDGVTLVPDRATVLAATAERYGVDVEPAQHIDVYRPANCRLCVMLASDVEILRRDREELRALKAARAATKRRERRGRSLVLDVDRLLLLAADGRTVREIARMTGIPPTSVWRALRSAA